MKINYYNIETTPRIMAEILEIIKNITLHKIKNLTKY